MGQVVVSNCGVMPASFFEKLASCVMIDDDGNTFLNVMCYDLDCGDYEPALHCAEPTNDAEALCCCKCFRS